MMGGYHVQRPLQCGSEGNMSNSRRRLLGSASAALTALVTACRHKSASASDAVPPGTPPAFGTSPDAGPPVSPSTFAEAEKLLQFELSSGEREMAAGNWRNSMAPLYERRTGPRKFSPPPSIAPASSWNPVLPGQEGALADSLLAALE